MLSFFESYFNHFSTERNTILHDSVNIMALHLPYWVIPSNKLTGFCEKFGHCCDNLSSVYHTNLEGLLAEVHHMTKIGFRALPLDRVEKMFSQPHAAKMSTKKAPNPISPLLQRSRIGGSYSATISSLARISLSKTSAISLFGSDTLHIMSPEGEIPISSALR